MNKLSVLKLSPFILIAIVLALNFQSVTVQSFTDFFIKGNSTGLNSVSIWNSLNFGSSSAGELWRLFPLGVFFYIFTNLIELPANITLFLLMLLLFSASYFYFTKTCNMFFGRHLDNIAISIAGIFYVFNTYPLTQLSNSFLLIIPYLAMPIQIYIFMRAMESKKYIKFGIILSLLNLMVFGVNLIFAVITILLISTIGTWNILIQRKYTIRELIKFGTLTGMMTLSLISFWLFPQIYGSLIDTRTSSYVLESEDFYNNDSSVLNVIRGLGDWGFFGSNAGIPYHSFSDVYKTNVLVVFSGFIILIIALLPLTSKQLKKDNKTVLLFYMILFIAIPVIGGTHASWPTAPIMNYLFENIPYFMAFRNTYKFTMVSMFALSILIAYSLTVLTSNKSIKYKSILMTLASGAVILNAFPFFSGSVVSNSQQINSIPSYWYEAAAHINSDKSANSRILLLPNQYFEVFEWDGQQKSFPRNLEATLLNKPVIHNTCDGCGTPDTSAIISYIYDNIDDPKTIKLLGSLGITHILQRNDFAHEYYQVETPDEIKNILNRSSDLDKVKSFGKLDLYELDKNIVNDVFYSPDSLTTTDRIEEFNEALQKDLSSNPGTLLINQTQGVDFVNSVSKYYRRLYDKDELKVVNSQAITELNINNNAIYKIEAVNTKNSANYELSYRTIGDRTVIELKQLRDKISVSNVGPIELAADIPPRQIDLGVLEQSVSILINNKSYLLDPKKPKILDTLSLAPGVFNLDIYSLASTSLVNDLENSSFETQPWQNKVQNCQQSNPNARISMKLHNESYEGRKSLSLSSSEDTACTYSPPLSNFVSGVYYFSFYSKNLEGKSPAYCVWDGKGCITYDSVASGKDWTKTEDVAYLDSTATNFYLYLYSQRSNFKKTTNLYDKVEVRRLDKLMSSTAVQLTPTTSKPASISLKAAAYTINSQLILDNENLIDNGSFDSGPWKDEVGNCSGNDDTGLSMTVVNRGNSNRALQLRSDNETACTYSDAVKSFDRDTLYTLKVDYQIYSGDGGRICLWDGESCIEDRLLSANDNKWHTQEFIVQPTDTSRLLNVYLYAPAGKSGSSINFDNVQLKKLKNNFLNTYTLESSNRPALESLKISNVERVSPTRYIFQASNIGKNVLVFQESFHPGWKLYLVKNRDAKLKSRQIDTDDLHQIPDSNHFTASGFSNGWIIDRSNIPDEVSSNYNAQYTLVALYKPQQMTYINIFISAAALVIMVLVLAIDLRKRSGKSTTYKYKKSQ